jgi:peptide/nickel transport system substrate-binding protein
VVERWSGEISHPGGSCGTTPSRFQFPIQEDTYVNTTRRGRSALALVAASALVFAACGSDDDDADTGDTGGETTETTEAPDGTEAPDTDTTEDTTDGGGEAAGNVGEVGGSACGTPHGPYDDGEDPAGEVRVAWNQAPYSFNQNTNRGNATANANPIYIMTAGGFSYYDADLNYINNDNFGTCTLDSLDPLTITYTINEGVTWSDGVQVDAADMLMTWAAQSGFYNDADTVVTETGVTAQADEEGSAVVVGPDGADITSVDEAAYDAAFDPDTGELLDGYSYKESTGTNFDSSSESLALITTVPEISEDGLSLTATWDSFYVDFATAGVFPGVPAHVVGQRALGIDDPTEAKTALIEALQGSTEDVKAISDSWNRDFDATSLPDDPGVYAGYGPYNLTSFDDDGTMVFEAREDYTWGPQPKVQTIVYSIIGDPTAAVQAMANEEVDIIQPQATADILTQLEGIADRGVEVRQSDGAVYEHVDLVFNNGGPFDPATYDGDEETARAVRQAFLLAVPRTDIVERLIVPLNENAEVRQSLIQVPGSPLYDEATANNGSDFYAEADPEGAAQILADAGVDTSTPIDVRLLFADENPRRASEYELIRDSVAQAGFNLIDGRDINWGSNLANNTLYDASLFGWQTTAIAIADTAANFITDGQNNFGGYSNETIDALYEELQATTDPARQDEILVEIESVLFEDAFGLPIFQFPQITAFNTTYVSGVSDIPISPTVFFNVWEWEATG